MYVLDTNAIVYYVNDDREALAILSSILADEIIIVPSIVITELWSSTKTSQTEMQKIESFLNSTLVVKLDADLAQAAGILRRDYSMSLGDSVVAATALAARATLFTRNVRDFKKIPGLQIKKV